MWRDRFSRRSMLKIELLDSTLRFESSKFWQSRTACGRRDAMVLLERARKVAAARIADAAADLFD